MLQQLGALFKRMFGSQPQVEVPGWAWEERRAWERRLCDLHVSFRLADDSDGASFSGHLRNISRGGLCMESTRQFEPGTHLAVELPGDQADQRSTVLARVVWTAPGGEGTWKVGCAFVAEMGEQELLPLGALKVRSTEPGGRVWMRYPCHMLASYTVVRSPDVGRQPATILDLSASGIGLTVFRAIDVGTLLSLELKGKDEQHNISILACVVRSRREGPANWTVGCSFISELDHGQFEGLLA
jgi:Tfp pilus assembly protein PilZ